MTVIIDRVAPVAHLPLVLGVLRKLDVASLVDSMILPHPEQIVSAGRAVEALVLAILDGHHPEHGLSELRLVSGLKGMATKSHRWVATDDVAVFA